MSCVESICDDYSNGLGYTRKEAINRLMEWYMDAVSQNEGKGFLTIRPEILVGHGRFTRSSDNLSYDKGEITQLNSFLSQLKLTHPTVTNDY